MDRESIIRTTCYHHQMILKAIKEKNRMGAMNLMEEHIQYTEGLLKNHYKTEKLSVEPIKLNKNIIIDSIINI